jgi:hypothetical protein
MQRHEGPPNKRTPVRMLKVLLFIIFVLLGLIASKLLSRWLL